MSNAIEKWLGNKSLNPFREMEQLQTSFDRLFSDFQNLKKQNSMSEFEFSPTCEVSEEENKYVFKFDLPGVSKDQVKVELINDRLSVKAERKEERKQETKKKYLSEVFYGSFERNFTLPGPVDEKKVDAKFENGVLTITIPKTESIQGKKIQIQ